MGRTHYTVVRNEHYTTGRVATVDGHNERTNGNPMNCDIHEERRHLNVHFRRCLNDDGTPETYNESIDRLLQSRTIVKYNFKPKSAIIDELVYDVNTEYFDERGGYDFAVKFYEEVYKLAVKEVGGEQYILSAVLHADERNKNLSDKLGHDAWHYHLHVVYVPVVEGREVKYTARAGPELQGKVKEVINQINHTDKWPRVKVGRDYVNEYSKLQDRYYEHMRAAGFDGFERGEYGSTVEHLTDLEYKTQQELKRNADAEEQTEQSQKQLRAAEKKLEKAQGDLAAAQTNLTAAQNQLAVADKDLAAKKKKLKIAKVHGAAIGEIEMAAKPTVLGNKVTISKEDWDRISELAKLGVAADEKIEDAQAEAEAYKKSAEKAHKELARVKNGVKRGDLSVVYDFKDRFQDAKEQAARDNADRAVNSVNINKNKKKQEEL